MQMYVVITVRQREVQCVLGEVQGEHGALICTMYNQLKMLSLLYVNGKLKRPRYTIKIIFTDGLEICSEGIESISLPECLLKDFVTSI